MSTGVNQVVAHFNEIVKPDGGWVKLLAKEGGTLRIEYSPGVNEQCESCVIPGSDLADMMKDFVREQDASITEVLVTEVPLTEDTGTEVPASEVTQLEGS